MSGGGGGMSTNRDIRAAFSRAFRVNSSLSFPRERL